MTLILFGMALPWLLVGLGCWLTYQLARQNGRILLRLEELEEQLGLLRALLAMESSPPTALPVASAAPDFELPDLDGKPHKPSQFRGRRVLLIFFNPECGYCRRMVPDLAVLPPGADQPLPLIITTGAAEENRALLKGLDASRVLLQAETETADRYQIPGTPMGYLVDDQGKIASELARGAEALLTLARTPWPADSAQPSSAPSGNGHLRTPARGKTNRGLATSRINRSGLKAGTPAPDFRLPRLDRGELALQDYRGRRVLLVFSDPECGPCEQLAPHLERFHRRHPDIGVVMISRRDTDINRRKVEALGLTFPVVLQRHWQISLLYGMFVTPMAYLIDEQGIIAADVASGVDAVQALMSGAVVAAKEKLAAGRKEVVPMRP